MMIPLTSSSSPLCSLTLLVHSSTSTKPSPSTMPAEPPPRPSPLPPPLGPHPGTTIFLSIPIRTSFAISRSASVADELSARTCSFVTNGGSARLKFKTSATRMELRPDRRRGTELNWYRKIRLTRPRIALEA